MVEQFDRVEELLLHREDERIARSPRDSLLAAIVNSCHRGSQRQSRRDRSHSSARLPERC